MMITETAANKGRSVTEYAVRRAEAGQTLAADRTGTLGDTQADLSFDVVFATGTVHFPEPDRQFFDWADDPAH